MTYQSAGSPQLDQILHACRQAAARGNPGPLSTGESLVAALTLNRPDWLADMDYTIVQALARIGEEWASLLPAAAAALAREQVASKIAREERAKASIRPTPASGDAAIDYRGELVTYATSPGYRDVTLMLRLQEIGQGGHTPWRANITLRPADSEEVARAIIDVHRQAWSGDGPPIDFKEGESKPKWTEAKD